MKPTPNQLQQFINDCQLNECEIMDLLEGRGMICDCTFAYEVSSDKCAVAVAYLSEHYRPLSGTNVGNTKQ